jgi:CTP synthase (UTP-ammonia lyase)
MPRELSIGVIGDFNARSETHAATNLAFRHAATRLGVQVGIEWVSTISLEEHAEDRLGRFDAFLCAPGSPYRSMRGALNGIRFAREDDRPLLGTCGGFQHMVLEYARNVMGIEGAEHAEEHPEAPDLFITPLACSLLGKVEEVRLSPGSRAFGIYNSSRTLERFYCNYGLNPARRAEVEQAGLRPSGFDSSGEVRILELPKARFFLATLFVPQASSSEDWPHPLICALLEAAHREASNFT